ncbi:MAG TPA: hypothetical protein VI564_01415 [Candidatus Nanoarchaeia archaeon]|nr:hypothetical protein [Candidatus Nanoarchaeia archaeon]
MEQKIFHNKAHNFDVESFGSEFDNMFDTGSIVDKIKRERMKNRVF